MSRSAKDRLRDIVEAAARCRDYLATLEGPQDRKTLDAIERNLEIIGEAANRLPADIRDRHRDIPWPSIIAFRNRIAHEYFRIDADNLRRTVEVHLPKLLEAVSQELD